MTEQEKLGQAIIDGRKRDPKLTASKVHDRLMKIDKIISAHVPPPPVPFTFTPECQLPSNNGNGNHV